jgi:RHS repeat-associated protein
MQAPFTYDSTPQHVHLCALNASRYTGKERDAESGNDYFPARYYASSMGRFLSPDPSALYMADPENPQTLNLYAYVGNNPLRYTDPLGLSKDCGGGGDPSVVCMVTTAWDWLKNAFGGGNSDPGPSPSAPGGGGPGQEPDNNLTPPASPLRFQNRQAAGIAAARQAIGMTSQRDPNGGCPAGCKYEWGGLVLKGSGGYTFTNPVTFKDSGHFWSNHVMVPFGYRRVGSYHTHPGARVNPNGDGMSLNDAQSTIPTGMPEFMGEEMTGKVWKFDPQSMPPCQAEPCGSVVFNPSSPQ